jgi:hypothetical protein
VRRALVVVVLCAGVVISGALAGPGPREFWVGPSFQNMPAARHAENPSVPTFIYGKCLPAPQGGCLPPLQIQNWHLRKRHPSRYVRAIRCVRGTIKRVPAAVFQTTGGLEVYAGRTVVFIVAREPANVLAAARALRPYGATRSPVRLAAPPAGVPKALRRCRRGNLQKALEAGA